MVELIKLEADVLDGELQQVPETSQVLGCGPWVGIHILTTRGRRGVKMSKQLRNDEETGHYCSVGSAQGYGF